jgi:biotin carboxyl carrier protein
MTIWLETPAGHRVEVLTTPGPEGTRTVVRAGGGDVLVREVMLRQAPNGDWMVESGGVTRTVQVTEDRDVIWLSDPGATDPRSATVVLRKVMSRPSGPPADRHLCTPMTGRVVSVAVKPGEQVRRGLALVVVEAMKMEHVVRAPWDGTVERLACHVGLIVETGGELLVLDRAQAS